MTSFEFHAAACDASRQHYLDALDAKQGALDWQEALAEGRGIVVNALKASDYLRDVAAALRQSGHHMLALRQMLSPPKSQDQFRFICSAWSKSSEKSGAPLGEEAAEAVGQSFAEWRSRRLTHWLDAGREPETAEIEHLILTTATLIASQRLATARRNRLAKEQEQAVIDLLEAAGWARETSRLVEESSDLPGLHYMHKTRFSSGEDQSQEVDIACGLGKSVILAMECKVTNDETNSVKRINDVLKKAAAWKYQWGNYVRTAALLQGVIKKDDVRRLLDAGVQVFWSHRLGDFSVWLNANIKT